MVNQIGQAARTPRLDFSGLQRRLAALSIEACFYYPSDRHIEGLSPKALFCQRMCQTHRHCQDFLARLAEDSIENPTLKYRCCLPGAFTLVAPVCRSNHDTPLVLGCFLTCSLGPSEELLRAASQLQLDHTALLSSVSKDARRRPEDLDLLTEMMGGIAEDHYRCTKQVYEIESLSQNLADTYEEVSFIYELNNAMNVTANPQEQFQQIAEDFRELLAVRAVLVVLFPEALASGEEQSRIIYSGELPVAAEQIIENAYPRILAKDSGMGIVREDLSHCPIHTADTEGIGQIMLAPILRSDKEMGMIVVLDPIDGRHFDNIDATRLSSLSNSAAVFLENFRLYGSMHQLFLGSIRALTSSIDAKDPYTSGHSERAALISKRLVELMGLPSSEVDHIYLCGLLHDIGKIGVPEAVLRKPDRLTPYELELVKQHPAIGAKIISGIDQMENLVSVVLHHHERVDGQGYPDGLSGEQIPFAARVLCVADCLDAMTSDRPYRKALPLKLAESEILRGAGSQFDPALVECMTRAKLTEYLIELKKSKSLFVPDEYYTRISQVTGDKRTEF